MKLNISWLGTAWAAVKGAFSFGTSAKISIVDYVLDAVNTYVASVDEIMANVEKVYAKLVWVCDKLDYYSAWIPTPWAGYYQNICDALGALRDTLADGKVERTEIERIVALVKAAIKNWKGA